MQNILMLFLLLTIILLVFLLQQVRQLATKADSQAVQKLLKDGYAKSLVQNAEKVAVGQSKNEVEDILGRADNPQDKEWLYYLDGSSGYMVNFDNFDRVSSIRLWVS